MTIQRLLETKWLNADATYGLHRTDECVPITQKDFVQVRDDLKLMHIAPTIGSVKFFEWFNTAPKSETLSFAGTLVSTLEEYDSMQPNLASKKVRSKPHRSMKEFLELKNSGVIVTNPMSQFKYNAVEIPKPVIFGNGTSSSGPRHGSLLPLGHPVGNCALDNQKRLGFPGAEGFYLSDRAVSTVHNVETIRGEHVVRKLQSSELEAYCDQYIRDVRDLFEKKTGLITEVRAEANSRVYDILTELGELPETIKYIISLIKRIFTLYRDTRKKLTGRKRSRGQTAAAYADETASLWMETRYAIMPIAYSVQDSLDALNAQSVKYQTYRAGETLTVPLVHFGQEKFVPITHRCWLKRHFAAELSTRDHLKTDLFSTAWELVPLSLVIDWALNIGDLITSIGVPSNVQQEAATYSWQVKDNVVLETSVGSNIHLSYEIYETVPISPGLEIGLNFDLNLNFKRSMDALALSWMLFKKKG